MARNDDAETGSMMQGPIATDARRAVLEAQHMYRRVLMGWASDALVLRRRGLDAIRWQARDEGRTWSQAA